MNRAFVYGDLLFETIKVINGKAELAAYHCERITAAADILGFKLPENWGLPFFNDWVLSQTKGRSVRLRMVIYRSGTGFYKPVLNDVEFKAETWPLPKDKEQKVVKNLGVFRAYFKPCHALSNVKSGNALIYVMAARYAEQHQFDDVLILNQYGRVAEATSSNVFWVQNGIIYTTPLSEAPVAGVMRRFVIQKLQEVNIEVVEQEVLPEQLAEADAIFLTNAISGIVWVDNLLNKKMDEQVISQWRKLIN